MAIRAGQEIDAWCTRCKMDLTHKVVAAVGDKPAKVECRTCYSIHMYRAPKSSPAAITRAASSGARATTTRAHARRAEPEPVLPAEPPAGVRVLPYRMTERFSKDQWLQHKSFGHGLVVNELGDDKIEVRFDAGLKVLAHNRTD